MNFRSRSYRLAGCCVLSITIVLLDGLTGFTQAPQAEHHFPTQPNPRITITSASTISIAPWGNNEVSITAEVSGATLQVDEVRITAEKSKLDITCEPSKPDRSIYLTLRVPAKATVDIKSNGNRVEIKEPVAPVTILASKELIQLGVPESCSLEMENAPRAVEHRQMASGYARIGLGKRSGTGPPFIKVTAPTAQVIVVRGYIPPVTPLTLVTSITPAMSFTRNPTLAATTIARRNSSMSRALRRSNPQLIRLLRDQPASVNSPDLEEGSLKLETHLVNLNVSATDNAGKAIPDLKQGDFSVYEDGVKQQISFFSPERAPFNLVLLIDLSGSMKDEIELIKETAIHFLDAIGAQDSIAVVTFTTDVTVVSHLTKDRDDLRESIEWMLAPAGGTAFYDALGYALVEEFRKVKRERNAVIAITDGEDNMLQEKLVEKLRPGYMRGRATGSFLTFEELLDGATESDALIYPIHLNPTPPQPIIPANIAPLALSQSPLLQVQSELTEIATKQLHSLADASGGRFYHANRIADLKGVFDQVAAELRTVYSMAYTPTNLNFDGRFRKIRVQVNKPDVAIHTRPGYYGR
jgi:VWFA-related protein